MNSNRKFLPVKKMPCRNQRYILRPPSNRKKFLNRRLWIRWNNLTENRLSNAVSKEKNVFLKKSQLIPPNGFISQAQTDILLSEQRQLHPTLNVNGPLTINVTCWISYILQWWFQVPWTVKEKNIMSLQKEFFGIYAIMITERAIAQSNIFLFELNPDISIGVSNTNSI